MLFVVVQAKCNGVHRIKVHLFFDKGSLFIKEEAGLIFSQHFVEARAFKTDDQLAYPPHLQGLLPDVPNKRDFRTVHILFTPVASSLQLLLAEC